jgi:hypothetical protein
VQQVQRVGAVVHVVNSVVPGLDRQAEQVARAGRRPSAAVQPPDGDLGAERRNLDQVPVPAVDGEDVAVGGMTATP